MSPYSICILQIDEWTKKRYCQYLTPKGTMPKVMDGKFINKIWRVTQTLKIWSSYPTSLVTGRDGKSSQLVFGGQRGKKGTLDVIRTRATLLRR